MEQEKYLEELEYYLMDLPREEREEALSYCREYLEKLVEEGQGLEVLAPPRDVAENIMQGMLEEEKEQQTQSDSYEEKNKLEKEIELEVIDFDFEDNFEDDFEEEESHPYVQNFLLLDEDTIGEWKEEPIGPEWKEEPIAPERKEEPIVPERDEEAETSEPVVFPEKETRKTTWNREAFDWKFAVLFLFLLLLIFKRDFAGKLLMGIGIGIVAVTAGVGALCLVLTGGGIFGGVGGLFSAVSAWMGGKIPEAVFLLGLSCVMVAVGLFSATLVILYLTRFLPWLWERLVWLLEFFQGRKEKGGTADWMSS